jgi:hypothetical protein
MTTITTSLKRYVSLANGTRQDASATLRDARMVMTTRPEEGHLRFENTISPNLTTLGRYDLIGVNLALQGLTPSPIGRLTLFESAFLMVQKVFSMKLLQLQHTKPLLLT